MFWNAITVYSHIYSPFMIDFSNVVIVAIVMWAPYE
jgi:hypothetical protein